MLSKSNRCEHCRAVVRNIDGRRHPITRLNEIHERSCPGLLRASKSSGNK